MPVGLPILDFCIKERKPQDVALCGASTPSSVSTAAAARFQATSSQAAVFTNPGLSVSEPSTRRSRGVSKT